MDQLWQGMGPRALQKQVSVSSRLCPFFPSLSPSFCYLHCWRHTLHIETTLGKFCHIVLSHPRRKLALPWTPAFHLQLNKQELVGSGAEGSSLSYGISRFLGVWWAHRSFSDSLLLYGILHCVARTTCYGEVRYGSGVCSDPQSGAWGGEPGRPVPEAARLHRGAEWVPWVKMVSSSHLWADSNQRCVTSRQKLFRDRPMHGWSADSLLRSSLYFIYF